MESGIFAVSCVARESWVKQFLHTGLLTNPIWITILISLSHMPVAFTSWLTYFGIAFGLIYLPTPSGQRKAIAQSIILYCKFPY